MEPHHHLLLGHGAAVGALAVRSWEAVLCLGAPQRERRRELVHRAEALHATAVPDVAGWHGDMQVETVLTPDVPHRWQELVALSQSALLIVRRAVDHVWLARRVARLLVKQISKPAVVKQAVSRAGIVFCAPEGMSAGCGGFHRLALVCSFAKGTNQNVVTPRESSYVPLSQPSDSEPS